MVEYLITHQDKFIMCLYVVGEDLEVKQKEQHQPSAPILYPDQYKCFMENKQPINLKKTWTRMLDDKTNNDIKITKPFGTPHKIPEIYPNIEELDNFKLSKLPQSPRLPDEPKDKNQTEIQDELDFTRYQTHGLQKAQEINKTAQKITDLATETFQTISTINHQK